MKALSLNKDKLAKYGYPEEMEYDVKDFNGHLITISLGWISVDGKEIYDNYLPDSLGTKEERDNILFEILENEDLYVLEFTKLRRNEQDGEVKEEKLIVLPYALPEHNAYLPTPNFEDLSGTPLYTREVTVEFLFSKNGLNRYCYYNYITDLQTPWDVVKQYLENLDENTSKQIGLQKTSTGDEHVYIFDMYDKLGNKEYESFESFDDLKDSLLSWRVIDSKEKIPVSEVI